MVKKKSTEDQEPETRTTGIGDNSVSGKKLLGYIKHLETLDKKKDQVLQEVREVYADVQGIGYSSKTVRKLIKLRKMEPEKRKEDEELLETYQRAIGMLDE